MHLLVPGAPMDSSAGLRDRNVDAKRGSSIYWDSVINKESPSVNRAPSINRGATTPQGYFIYDSPVALPHKSQAVSLAGRDKSAPTGLSSFI